MSIGRREWSGDGMRMSLVNKKVLTILILCIIVVVFIPRILPENFYDRVMKKIYPLEVMSPVPRFSSLCDSSKFTHYESQENIQRLEAGDVWEKHYSLDSLPKKLKSSIENFFDYEEFHPVAVWRRPDGGELTINGFYDGDKFIKFRTRLITTGRWHYELRVNGIAVERLAVDVAPRSKESSRIEQIQIDPSNPSGLLAGSKPFYWIGGKWFSAQNMAPCAINQHWHLRATHRQISDEDYLKYLDYLVETGHNAYLHKVALFPLLGDGISWDTQWIQRIEWGVRQALARGLYVQINLFDTWSRDANFKVINNTSASEQVFDVWEPNQADLALAKNYLTTLVARLAAYPNIFWELGNEMEHKPNCGDCFVKNSNAFYIPWLRELDPYNHLIGLSESVWLDADVDIGFLHQTTISDFSREYIDSRPRLLNELVRSEGTDVLWKDATMRDPSARLAFRRTFWRSLLFGLTGSFEATWFNVRYQYNDASKRVMQDHQRVQRFIEHQKINVNARLDGGLLQTNDRFDTYFLQLADGKQVYYFLSNKIGEKVSNWHIELGFLDLSAFSYQWFDPSSGEYFDVGEFARKNNVILSRLRTKRSAYDVVLIAKPSP